jgi:ATP-dependent Clp protease adapter protein ClpS
MNQLPDDSNQLFDQLFDLLRSVATMIKTLLPTMKIPTLSTLFVATVFLCGCSSTRFTEYHGSEAFQGTGDSVRVVDGIDFWENGDPDRKYKILGVIDESPRHRFPSGRLTRIFSDSGDRESAIAKAAHKQGGDAVIFVAKDQAASGVDQHGNEHPRRYAELVVIKYVD